MNLKLFSILLSIFVIFSLFAGCKSSKKNTLSQPEDQTPSISTSTVTTTSDKTSSEDDSNVPEIEDIIVNSNKNESSKKDKTSSSGSSTSSKMPQSLTEPEETNKPNSSKDNETSSKLPESNPDVPSPNQVNYEAYHAMSPNEQQAFFNSFDTVEAFFKWYNKEKAEYEKNNPDKEIGDGLIDIGGIIK